MKAAELHQGLLKVRRAEELLSSLYKNQEMRTPTHFGIGQEAVAVGVCAALDHTRGDVVFTHHRSHNHYLAMGGDFEALCAELYGRETGCSRGRGGSVHLTYRSTGFIASSAILGEMIAVATGAALSFKMDGKDSVAVCFFGEAAMEEGIAYESMNYASLMKLPVLFVCENNGYSTESPLSTRQPEGTELTDRAVMFRVGGMKADGNDVADVYATTHKALKHVRSGQPVFLECQTYRWLEHVGPNYDHEMNRTYRSKAELEEWQQRDPLKISDDNLSPKEQDQMERYDVQLQADLRAAAERAYAAPKPDRSTLFENVY